MVRPDIVRLYKSLHTWTGIISGMALFIAFYAGALTVFKEPIARWVSPPSPGLESATLADAPRLIEQVLQERPQASREFMLYLQASENVPAPLSWRELSAGAKPSGHDGQANAQHFAARLANDRVVVEQHTPSALPEFIDTLHRVVGLPEDIDPYRRVMGVIAALYAVALVSGLIVLLPTLAKSLFALHIGPNLKRMWLDAHNLIGLASLPFHIIMALTSIVFAFHDDIFAIQDPMIHGGKLESIWRGPAPPAQPDVQAKPVPRNPADMLPPAALLAKVKAIAPDFVPKTMQYTQVTGPRATVRIWGFDDKDIARSDQGGLVRVDPYSGNILDTELLPGQQSPAAVTLTSFFTLHFANFGGTPVRWLYFVLGLAGAFLFYSGNLLWIESRRKAQRKGQPMPVQTKPTRGMAAATIGVCLGCVCGISLSVAAGKWLHGIVADLAAWHMAVYYVVFFACIAWSFSVGAARASVHLLWVASLSTLAIPLTSLVAWAMPSLGWWAYGTVAPLGVDATALLASVAWAWLARMTARRAMRGRPDSVWALSTSTPT